jgi:hypothetical protein
MRQEKRSTRICWSEAPTRGRLDHAVALGERFVAHLDLPLNGEVGW